MLIIQASLFKLSHYFIQTDLIQFVDSNGNINQFIGATTLLRQCRQYFSTINFYFDRYAELLKNGGINICQFYFIQQCITAYNICIALVEFTVTSFLRPVSPPNGLYLVTFKRHGKLAVIHGYVAGKGNSEIIFQCPFSQVFIIFAQQYFFKSCFGFINIFWIAKSIVKDLKN